MKHPFLLLLFLQIFYSAGFSQAGSLDVSFNHTGQQRTLIGPSRCEGRAVAIQPDQKILVAGFYSRDAAHGNGYSFGVARYLSTGVLDNNFGSGGIVTLDLTGSWSFCYSIAVQPADGKIILAGDYTSNNGLGTKNICLVKLTSTGAIDVGFNGGSPVLLPDYFGERMVLQPDGKIVVGADYYVPGSPTNKRSFAVVRFDSEGLLDPQFGNNGQAIMDVGGDDVVSGIVVQPDGKIVVSGSRDRNYIVAVRFNSNGLVDYNFASGGMAFVTIGSTGQDCAASNLALSPDGKIVIVGNYSTLNYSLDFLIVRLNTDGTLDNSFAGNGKKQVSFQNFDFGNAVVVQSDKKIIAVGESKDINTSNPFQFAICRLTATGSLDNGFGNGGETLSGWSGIDGIATAVAIQANGRIVAAGISTPDFGVMRFLASGSNLISSSIEGYRQTETSEISNIHLYPNPAQTQLQVSGLLQDQEATLTVIDVLGHVLMAKKVGGQSNYAVDISQLAAGSYMLRITGNQKQESLPFIKVK